MSKIRGGPGNRRRKGIVRSKYQTSIPGNGNNPLDWYIYCTGDADCPFGECCSQPDGNYCCILVTPDEPEPWV